MKLSPVLFVISATMLAVGDLMLIPAAVGWFSRFDDAERFLYSALIILVPAVLINLSARRPDVTILPRHAFAVTSLVWLIAAAGGALPIALHVGVSFTDAFFESMSGITTTAPRCWWVWITWPLRCCCGAPCCNGSAGSGS